MRLLSFMLVGAALIGCSTASTIQRADRDESAFADAAYSGETTILRDDIPDSETYRIFHQAATGFVSIQAVRYSAEKRADDYCAKRSKSVEVVRETTSAPPHVLGNFPRIEIVFACVDREVQESQASSGNDYDRLRELKSLLDEGVITPEEYQREKDEILSK